MAHLPRERHYSDEAQLTLCSIISTCEERLSAAQIREFDALYEGRILLGACLVAPSNVLQPPSSGLK